MANTYGEFGDYLLCPWIVRTYRDLFVNVGYRVEHEKKFRGSKNVVELDVQISFFRKTSNPGSDRQRSATLSILLKKSVSAGLEVAGVDVDLVRSFHDYVGQKAVQFDGPTRFETEIEVIKISKLRKCNALNHLDQ